MGPNVADFLRSELLNYELEIQYAESRIARLKAAMDRSESIKSAKANRRFVYAKIRYEAWVCFRDDLLRAKASLARGIDNALGSYPKPFRRIFWDCILNERKPSDVAAEMGLSESAVVRIRDKLKRDLHSLYRP